METNVFERTHTTATEISAHLYNAIIGITLLVGFAINYAMVKYIPVEAILSINTWVFFIGYFVCCMAGVALFSRSDNPAVSFLGYLLVVTPFGLVINLVVSRYNPAIVIDAIQATALITTIMMILGTMYPAFFRGIARGLFVALLCTIVVELVAIFIFKTHHTIIDWIVVLIFSGYIGVDWGRANSIPRTVDNAIDSAAALYMDIINLFLRLVRILGRR
ncbi:Integral membrane protein, interacts with FtsH [Malonomonas rubra DSM 5091]|uniref:Integral membrane protein, interacts with FtsH n=1 Tax=Malonomonas rubra DSM 5091 TaxID=1122189 RepID=A0A1M6JEI1_MALRU|nr:Bax inhibitor-1 family protein [Malonomonas rubra]SHJ45050.1 Integral membrane protein, interacts with FtsH [Malonomonas rubra DSM 5091]